MLPRSLPGPYGAIPVLIRDDDTNFFTDPSMLQTIYSCAWEAGFKVSLSVVPLQKGVNDLLVPPGVRSSAREYSIADNKEIVSYLKEKISQKSIEVLQHGLFHERLGPRGEFGTPANKKKEIELGNTILTEALGTKPKFFVPPGEDISRQNLNEVISLGMIPIFRNSFLDKLIRSRLVPGIIKETSLKAYIKKYRRDAEKQDIAPFSFKPVLIDVGDDRINWSLASTSTLNHLFHSADTLANLSSRVIEYCTLTRSPVCILNHYHVYYSDWDSSITKHDLYKALDEFLKSFAKLNTIWKVGFAELYDRTSKMRYVFITENGSKITVHSDVYLENYSFRAHNAIEPNDSVEFEKETLTGTIKYLQPGSKIILYEK
jgi:hypothetical protein